MALPKRDLSLADFKANEVNWIQQDPKHFPPGTVTNFEWKDYCPVVFRQLRELENIDNSDYMSAICGQETLREVSSPGKTGSLIFFDKDDRFVLKTMRKSEVKVLQEILPNYYRHVKKYGATLLTKVYGLHVVRPEGGLKVYFVVVANIFPSGSRIPKCYDLKGSSQGRTVSTRGIPERIILKDKDFDFCFYLDPLVQHRLLAQIKYDCEFLETEGVMNYSLLIGMQTESSHRDTFDDRSSNTKKTVSNNFLGNEDRELTITDICQRPNRPGFKYGEKLPARAVRTHWNEMRNMSSNGRITSQKSYNVLLYFGIIDFFQSYNVIKQIEHAYKSLHYRSNSFSAVNPKLYSSRLQDFLSKVFQAEDSDL